MKMSRWKLKRKKWLDRHSRLKKRRIKKSSRSKRHTKLVPTSPYIKRMSGKGALPTISLTPPQNFSLLDNPEETMKFFAGFAEEIEKKEQKKHFFVDSSKVEVVTVDALIYLIAILQNVKFNVAMHYSFSGNYPHNQEANTVYKESGFTDYVRSKMRNLPQSTEKMRIVSGTKNNSDISKDVCEFVITTLRKTKREIQPLQKVLIELMSNVFYHAYEKNTSMAKKWYIYAEHIDDSVRCVFVDTGQGIAKTVKRNFGEYIKEKFLRMQLNDSELINSVFNGDFRTATKKKYRGNGLASVKEFVRSELFEEFEVLSGRGRCILPNSESTDDICIKNYSNALYGTLYTFVIK